MNKSILSALFLSLLSQSAFAEAALTLVDDAGNLQIEIDGDTGKVALFENENSMWFASVDNSPVILNVPSELRKKYNVEEVELLKVVGGSGVRLQFKQLPEYSIRYLDVPKTEKSSFLSLSEGFVFSGNDPVKVLQAHSDKLGKTITVVPSAQGVALDAQTYKNGMNSLSTKVGYAFTTKEGLPLESLYQNKQQLLAQSKEVLIAMAASLGNPYAEPAADKPVENVETTRIKPAPLLNSPVASLQPLETAKVESESVAAPSFSLIQFIEESPKATLRTGVQGSSNKVVLTTKGRPAVKAEVLEAQAESFEKDEYAYTRAVDTLSQAKNRLLNAYMPKITVPMLENSEEKALPVAERVQVKKPDNFVNFFGNDVVDESNIEDVYKKAPKVSEIPDVSNATTAVRFAENAVFGENIQEIKVIDKRRVELAQAFAMQEEFKVPELLPNEPLFQIYGTGKPEDFQAFQHEFLNEIATSSSQIQRQKSRLKLAKLYMYNHRPQEVIMTMSNMPKVGKTQQIQDVAARLLTGVANLMVNRPKEALFYLEVSDEHFEDDRNLWLAVNHEMLDQDVQSLDIFKNYIQAADEYPKALIKEVYLSYGRALLRQERLSDLKKVMQDLTMKLKTPNLPPEGLILLAKANILQRNDDLAETLLSQAAVSDNKEVAFLAQYEFLNFLLNRGDLGVVQAIEHMENLRRLWRGGEVESEILLKLGRMYLARGEQRKGLERLKHHNIYFVQNKENAEVTDLMSKAFTDLYLDETAPSKLDPLSLLGLYYDFRELTPQGEAGDKLIEQIAGRLRRLGLFDRATQVLERQLDFRVKDPETRVKMGADLAQIYVLNAQFDQGLNTLNRTEAEVNQKVPDSLIARRLMVKAEAFVGLKQYDKALELLNNKTDDEALHLKAKIAWILDKYDDVVKNYQPIYDNPKNLPKVWGDEEKVDFVRLAVAYNALRRSDDLDSLIKRYENEILSDVQVGRVVNFLLKDQNLDVLTYEAESEDKKKLWEGLTKSLTAYHDFANYYEKVVSERERERRDKDIFNRRQRQLSAPPRY